MEYVSTDAAFYVGVVGRRVGYDSGKVLVDGAGDLVSIYYQALYPKEIALT